MRTIVNIRTPAIAVSEIGMAHSNYQRKPRIHSQWIWFVMCATSSCRSSETILAAKTQLHQVKPNVLSWKNELHRPIPKRFEKINSIQSSRFFCWLKKRQYLISNEEISLWRVLTWLHWWCIAVETIKSEDSKIK